MKKTNLTENDLTSIPFEDLLSAVLRHPDIPEKLDDIIRETITDMFNRSEQSWVAMYESSPEYIAQVIESSSKRDKEKESAEEWPGQLSLVG